MNSTLLQAASAPPDPSWYTSLVEHGPSIAGAAFAFLVALEVLLSAIAAATRWTGDDIAASTLRAWVARLSFLRPSSYTMPGRLPRDRDGIDIDVEAPPDVTRKLPPPPPTGLPLLLVAASSALLASSGCGASALDEHAIVATVTHEIAVVGRQAILEERRRQLVAGGEAALEEGEPVRPAVEEAAEGFDSGLGGQIVEGYNAFAGAANAYARGVLAEARGMLDSAVELVALGRHVATTYNALARLVEQLDGLELPIVPDWILEYLSNL
jgi:hypothetical protein